MAKARKLPSGNWNVTVFSHVDSSGKRIYRSFTDPDKKKAVKMAHEFQDSREEYHDAQMTVEKAVDEYISSKEGVLSPSTIREYRRLQKNAYESLDTIYVSRVTSKDLQYFVSEYAKSHSAKSTRNAYGLLISAISMFTDKRYRVTLPQKDVIEYDTPDDQEVKLLLDNASDTLKLCIYLSAVGTLRRGEIAALKYSDILYDMNAVYVHSDMVLDKDSKFVYKAMPKNSGSVRRVILPEDIVKMMGEGDSDDYVIGLTPDQISHRFTRLRNKLGLKCRFHDLRHYAATIRMYMGIPMKEIQAVGGWSGTDTLQKIYMNQLKSKSIEFTKKANQYFEENLMSEKRKKV